MFAMLDGCGNKNENLPDLGRLTTISIRIINLRNRIIMLLSCKNIGKKNK